MTCPLDYRDHYYTIDFDSFEEELKNGVKAVIFCNPHNPVGRVWTEEELAKVAHLCAAYGVYLLSDEVHCDYAFARPYTPMGKFEEIHDKLMSISLYCLCMWQCAAGTWKTGDEKRIPASFGCIISVYCDDLMRDEMIHEGKYISQTETKQNNQPVHTAIHRRFVMHESMSRKGAASCI